MSAAGGADPCQAERRRQFERERPGTRTEIEGEFPGWHAWVSDGGRWYAVRLGAVWQRACQVPLTVDAEDAAGLREKVAAAEQLAEGQMPGAVL